ncbi:unnamed protein product [Triticum turgidum subsp. durum]|uniref:Uncharacterized protein n=1 Tax=Triticum turgidum subsp. durum TaxID=4567 RepID=A0A9R1B7P1_TRITD|nr:unnamed protein product [Triticum turgidum subsp. durum]
MVMQHFRNRLRDEDPEKYYTRSSFCINCKWIHDQHTRDSEIHEHDDDCDRGSGGREHKDVWLTSRLLSGCLATACIHPLFIDGLEIFYEGNQKVAAISEISSPSELQLIQLDNVEV